MELIDSGDKMRRDTFHDHVTAKYNVIEADRNMTGTMPGQMDDLKWADSHVHVSYVKSTGTER